MDYDQLVEMIANKVVEKLLAMERGQCAKAVCKTTTLTKKLVTESEIKSISSLGFNKLIIAEKAILTELAKDYAQEQRIEIVRK
ncbi:MAG: hypothetical protein RR263_01100 [Oscillospiraceae bacterium]